MEKIGEKYVQIWDAGDGFVVEINLDGDMWNAWIYEEGTGVKSFMFGTTCKQLNDEAVSFIDLVEANVAQYKEYYNETYGD